MKKARDDSKALHAELAYIKKHLDKLWDHVAETNERLTDLEVQSNLMTRPVATLCLERMKISANSLTKMIRRIEKEAIDDSQIMHLEELFKLEHKKHGTPRNTN